MKDSKLPSLWNLEEDRLHSNCRIFEVRKQRFIRKSDGLRGDFFVLDTNDWVNVLALTRNDELVFVRQFRYGSKEFSLEPPGGVVEKGRTLFLQDYGNYRKRPVIPEKIQNCSELSGLMRPFCQIVVILYWFGMLKKQVG